MDFATILAGLVATTAIAAIIGAAVIVASVNFAKWGAHKVAGFFGR